MLLELAINKVESGPLIRNMVHWLVRMVLRPDGKPDFCTKEAQLQAAQDKD